ncbi:hypothetical protein [Anoxybacillus sp. J5B_2022]|uniref:hypothetical protein n=1 Tax=Anoxybacillus sp. J5B_2022 TaxID=3003246 RepID=UPI002286A8E0|nr:hypothetical protein [Anoxybacillus sp. J5B_2022]MCZ0756143.1 hypothetical protein [Anoxybacillus sp. J5B_2022]
MKKIICTATSFGYGPVSKLITICKNLKKLGLELELIGDGIALELANHTDYFNKVYRYNFTNIEDSSCIKFSKIFREADLMLNVLEPNAVLIANKYEIPTIYIDSLFWMWEDIPPILHNVKYYIAQRFPGISSKIKRFSKEIKNFYLCGPIVDTSFTSEGGRDDLLLINFSGLETPFTKIGENLYYPEAIMSNLISPLNESSWKEIVVTGNKSIMQHFKKLYGQFFRGHFKHLSHDNFLELMSKAKMIITSPGLTTTYEALVYGTPIRFLPPQNYSQALMLNFYQRCGFSDITLNWCDLYPDYIIPVDLPEEQGVFLVNNTIKRFSQDNLSQKIARNQFKKMIETPPPSIENQREILGETLSDGVSEIVNIIKNEVLVEKKI